MRTNHTYRGKWTQANWYEVTIDHAPFDPGPSQKVRNHSPDGFAWGYGGSGPAQLALAILLKETDKKTAQELYQDFKSDVIATLPKDEWHLQSSIIQNWIHKHKPKET